MTTTKRFTFFCLFLVLFTSLRFGAMIFIFNNRIAEDLYRAHSKHDFFQVDTKWRRFRRSTIYSDDFRLMLFQQQKNLLDKVSFLNRRRIFNLKDICHFRWTLHWETFDWKLKCRCDSQMWFLFWIQKKHKNHEFFKCWNTRFRCIQQTVKSIFYSKCSRVVCISKNTTAIKYSN